MHKPKLAVFKFASCDGCQLTLLDCEDELLSIFERLDIAYFLEASSKKVKGPYDLTLVEGSISTQKDLARIQHVRKQSKYLVTIGACANKGGIQALRNYHDIDQYMNIVYAKKEYIDTLDKSKPVSAYVKVDFELNGCPINKVQLLEVCKSFLINKKPNVSSFSLCSECKLAEHTCIMVANNTPCLGPITHAGCGAICPGFHRGCYGCYGPKETANPEPLTEWFKNNNHASNKQILTLLKNFNADADELAQTSKKYES